MAILLIPIFVKKKPVVQVELHYWSDNATALSMRYTDTCQ